MKVLEAFIQARDDAFNEGPEGRLQMPRWLSGSLILLIIINIVAYVAVTWITVAHIDRQITLLQAATTTNGTHLQGEKLPNNHLIILEEDHHTDHDSISAKIKALESRRSELITGVIIEIALDLVDLTDVFVGNFFIHVIYLVTKLFSIGLWSYSQLEQSNSVIWLLPLCICLLIILVHLRWFTALRKWVLALCIIVSTAAWTAVLFIRCRQIGAHISRLQALNHHLKEGDEGDEGEKERLKRVIEGEMQNRLILCIGTFLMIIFGSMGLMAECCRAPLVAIVFGVLHSIGFTLWLVKITFFSAQEADVLFCVPLIYAVLTIAIFIVFLFEFYNRFKKGNGKRRGNGKSGKSGKGKKKKGNKKKLLYTFVSDDDDEDEDENEDDEEEVEDSEQQQQQNNNNNNLSAKPQKSKKSTAKSSQKTAKMTKTNKTKTKTKTNKTKAKTNRTAKRYSQKHRTLKE